MTDRPTILDSRPVHAGRFVSEINRIAIDVLEWSGHINPAAARLLKDVLHGVCDDDIARAFADEDDVLL